PGEPGRGLRDLDAGSRRQDRARDRLHRAGALGRDAPERPASPHARRLARGAEVRVPRDHLARRGARAADRVVPRAPAGDPRAGGGVDASMSQNTEPAAPFERRELDRRRAKAAIYDAIAEGRADWVEKNRYYADEVARLVRSLIPPGSRVLE